MPCTLLLTATINPPSGVARLVRADSAVRLNDYAEALRFYLTVPDSVVDRIALIDNSASDVSPLWDVVAQAKTSKAVHITSFAGLDHPPAFGRGYGELKLLDWALAEFAPIASLPPETVFWKGTGRYKLLNIAQLVATMPPSFELYCDLRDRPHPWLDMRFFAFTRPWYDRHFRGRYRELREDLTDGVGPPGHSIPEVVLRHHLDRHLAEPGLVPRFRTEPLVDGIRSFDTRSFTAPRHLPKYVIRRVARTLTPGLWI